MSAFDPTGRYIFLPHETQFGAGLTRYDTVTDKAINLFHGDMNGAHGDWSGDFGALDPATWTPVNTLLVGEEWSGQGRIFEVMNPMADVAAGETIVMHELNSIPNVSHEGLRFNHAGSALYFIDEDRSGSVYKFVPAVAGDYSKGQSFVLVVNAFDGDASINWDAGVNATAVRTGQATWVPLTDADGVALPGISDPFDNATRGGRAAANDANGTPFGRPEDVEVGYLANGNEVVYFNATSENSVYSVEEKGEGKAMVRLAAGPTTPTNLGYAPTTGTISDPDNLAQDALGNIYVVEDKPNGDAVGGDVWFLRDTDGDGVAESLDHFMSLQVKGSENTGMIFSPVNPTQFIINVQHPESTDDAINGQGDATWLIDLKDVVAPPCVKGDHERGEHGEHNKVKTCTDSDDVNFVRKLIKAGR
jgi:secreted PhoX family phosphatase